MQLPFLFPWFSVTMCPSCQAFEYGIGTWFLFSRRGQPWLSLSSASWGVSVEKSPHLLDIPRAELSLIFDL